MWNEEYPCADCEEYVRIEHADNERVIYVNCAGCSPTKQQVVAVKTIGED